MGVAKTIIIRPCRDMTLSVMDTECHVLMQVARGCYSMAGSHPVAKCSYFNRRMRIRTVIVTNLTLLCVQHAPTL